jgi:hypothetical protein
MGNTAGVHPLLRQGMLLSGAAYPSVLQMREGHLLEIVLGIGIFKFLSAKFWHFYYLYLLL